MSDFKINKEILFMKEMVWTVRSIEGPGPTENLTLACMSLAELKKLCLLLLFILLLYLSTLCRVFTIIYLKQIMFLGYIVLQLFCI